jgi:glycosyltransferase involved in cell wall biosynthesis
VSRPSPLSSFSDKTINLSHDWLTGMRGGERVLELLCRDFPDAHIHSLLYYPDPFPDTITSHPVHTSWLQNLPGIRNQYRMYLPLFPSAVKGIKQRQADILISTSHCVAKGIQKPAGGKHLCYCFTPMRYAWTFYEEYFGTNPLKKLILSPILAQLRSWDKKRSDDVDRFVAISRHVQDRISRFYGRESDVVYPPVNTDRCIPSGSDPEDFDLIVSALVPYKRVDLAVEAYKSTGRKLKIVGIGGALDRLKQTAPANVEFLGWQSDDVVLDLYQRCTMLIFPGEEDFGIVPVEAQACGRPVVAFARGGALETVKKGLSGVFFEEQRPESLAAAVQECAGQTWDAGAIREHALGFSEQNFLQGLAKSLETMMSGR